MGVHRSSTYYCDGSLDENWQVPSATGDDAECKYGDQLYTDVNPYTNFSWHAPFPTRAEDLRYLSFSEEDYIHISDLMDEQRHSTDEDCTNIQDIYYYCDLWDDDPEDSIAWVINCDEWMTILMDTAYGIVCGVDDID